MGNPLFDRRAPADWSASGQVIDFDLELGKFDRLVAALEAELATLDAADRPADWRKARVTGRVEFGFAAEFRGTPTAAGSAGVDATTVCQRCLEPFVVRLAADFRLLLVDAGDALEEAQGFERWDLDEPAVRPADIVDELLVMALPFAARHEKENCNAADTSEEAPAADTVRPFADLRSQMERDN